MLRVISRRLAGAALFFAATASPALAANNPAPQAQATNAASDQANDTAAAPAETAKPKARPEDRKICRMVNGSESRLGAQKVCMTAEQWKHAEF